MKILVFSYDQPILVKYNFFEFCRHEKIDYEKTEKIETEYENIDFFIYLITARKKDAENEKLSEVLSGHLEFAQGIKSNQIIYCFHDFNKERTFTKNQKEITEELIKILVRKKILHCTHIFDLMQLLRVEKIYFEAVKYDLKA